MTCGPRGNDAPAVNPAPWRTPRRESSSAATATCRDAAGTSGCAAACSACSRSSCSQASSTHSGSDRPLRAQRAPRPICRSRRRRACVAACCGRRGSRSGRITELKQATLVLSQGWLEGNTINTIEPSPVGEASRNGSLSLDLGHVPARRALRALHPVPDEPDERRLAASPTCSCRTARSCSSPSIAP